MASSCSVSLPVKIVREKVLSGHGQVVCKRTMGITTLGGPSWLEALGS